MAVSADPDPGAVPGSSDGLRQEIRSAGVPSKLAKCQVSSETLAGEKNSRLFADTFKQTVVVTVAALQDSGKIPGIAKPGLSATRLALELTPAGLLVRSAGFLHKL
jgi:hypothetical protein